ncbi:hypothetical protein AB0A95_01005 [Micromonospora sp. NPDC049230]|uniref:hypothetical protein n=1 Tax=Micromonospora sp. NPDC049230 TaxID=3155502 RepID=UPI00340EF4DF
MTARWFEGDAAHGGDLAAAQPARRSTGRSVALAALAAVLVLTGCSNGPAGPPTAGATPPRSTSGLGQAPDVQPGESGSVSADEAQRRRLTAAATLVTTKPGVLGILVRDRRTGDLWQAGTTDHPIWTASTIKLAMAVGLLERARAGEITLDATARRQIADMLSVSSDDAATALWNRYGRDSQLKRFQQRYGMTGLTTVAGYSRFWGHLKCTADDLQRLMSYVLDRLDPTDRAYLLDAMRSVGSIQHWGVWAAGATQQPGTKNGWSIEPDPGGKHWVTNTVGFAGDGQRYVVAIMYQLPPGKTIDAGVHTVSDLVATVFGARTPARVTVPDPSTGL